MILQNNGQKKKNSVMLIITATVTAFVLNIGLVGCSVVEKKPSIISDIEKKFGKRVDKPSNDSDRVGYKTVEESGTLKVISIAPDEDLKDLGKQLAKEANDKSLMEVYVYDSENEARNYRLLLDPNMSPDDAAYEDNWDHLIAIYKKNTNAGENYIEIYNDVSHEDIEVVKF